MGTIDTNAPDTPDPGSKQESSLADRLASPISQRGAPRTLNVPDPTPPAGSDLTSEVERMMKQQPDGATKLGKEYAQAPAPPAPRPNLTVCPKCQARLSSLDNKMGYCFRCNAPLHDDDTVTPRGPISIGI